MDRAERAAAADLAHLEGEHEIPRLLAEAEPVVEGQRVEVRVQAEVPRATRAHVLDDRVDERLAGAVPALGLAHEEVADVRDVPVDPGAREANRLAVSLRDEEAVRIERALDLLARRLPARVGPGGKRVDVADELEPERANELAIGGGGVADGH